MDIWSLLAVIFVCPVIAVMLLTSSKRNGPLVDCTFQGKTYRVPPKYREFVNRALQGDKDAKYEIIIQYYENGKPYIPELCFKFACELAEKDLGVLTQLGDLYFEGIGTPKDEAKGRETYMRALELYDNPPKDLYIPEESKEYRNLLLEKSGLCEVKK